MAQNNIKKTSDFTVPPLGFKGLGFKESNGSLVIIDENGNAKEVSSIVAAYVANRGVGPVANLPGSVVDGDVYVANDTFEVYIATSDIGWEPAIDLIKNQIITDTSQTGINPPVYQFNGVELVQLAPTITTTDTINFTAITFDENGVSTETIESIYSFNIDANFVYLKRPDNYWVRSKIHKEVTPPGGLPE